MVSVSGKSVTSRSATAVAWLHFSRPETLDHLQQGSMPKGDVMAASRIAGIQAAKRTSELIPLCHNINLTSVSVRLNLEPINQVADGTDSGPFSQVSLQPHALKILATVESEGKTGVEMEALIAVQIAAATAYDMCKAVDKHIVISNIKVIRKSGGESGDWCLE